MNVELQVVARLALPDTPRPDAQSLYLFNMYRAGSSLTEAVGAELARFSDRTPFSPQGQLWRMGVTLVDPADFSRDAAYLSNEGSDLLKLCAFGGYVYMGFREIPGGFAEHFDHLDAAILVARDLRDIGISHYRAVNKHAAPDNIAGDNIRLLRRLVSSVSLEDYIMMPETTEFLLRLAECYRVPIERGLRVMRYEDCGCGERFDLSRFISAMVEAFAEYLPGDLDRAKFERWVRATVNASPDLSDHATSGRLREYRRLDSSLQARYTASLEPGLKLLGYI